MSGLNLGVRGVHRVEVVGLSSLVASHFVLLAETPLIGANVRFKSDRRRRFQA